ncbi:MAG: energy transducer TonB [Proteobacteria bacterium]|nr:energy transducer TonB [Pseudomonadota bacterium]
MIYGTKLPRYSKQPNDGDSCWNCCFLLSLILSIIAHCLFYALFVDREDKSAAIQSDKIQKSIEVTLSAAPKPKPSAGRAPVKPAPPKPVVKPKPAPKPIEIQPIAKPVPKPVTPQPKRPRPPTPAIQPEPPKPRRPVVRPRPVEPDENEVPEFKDDFAELSKDYSNDAPSTRGKISLDSKPALSDTGIRTGSIISVNPRITYPIQAMRQGMKGIVVVLIHIAPDGQTNGVDLLQSSGYDALDNEVLGAVQHWRFKPPMRGNTPVEGVYKHRVIFGVDEVVVDDFDQHWQEIKLLPAGE